jgi:hypothetical protein
LPRKPSSTTRRATATKPAPAPAKPKPKPQPDPHAGMDHSKMEMPKKK